jgi:protein CpxP
MKRPTLGFLLIVGFAAPAAMAVPTLVASQTGAPSPSVQRQESGRRWGDPAARAASHAARLREDLQLRPDQDSALTTYIAAMGHSGHGWAHSPDEHPREEQAMTTPERLDRMAAWLDSRRAAFTARAEATKKFYAQLSPAQQKAFDVMGDRGHGHGMVMRGGFHGHGSEDGPREHSGQSGPQSGE